MHPNTEALLAFFRYDHLPQGPLRETSERCHDLVHELIDSGLDGPEFTAGMRKLLEAKDCFVRAALPR